MALPDLADAGVAAMPRHQRRGSGGQMNGLALTQRGDFSIGNHVMQLAHDGFFVAGLQMRDPDIGLPIQISQGRRQRIRPMMFGGLSDFGKRIAERGFDDEMTQIGDGVERGGEGVAGGGVAAEHQAAAGAAELNGTGRHDVVDGKRGEGAPAQGGVCAHRQRFKFQPGCVEAGDGSEVRPQVPVEQVVGQDVEHFGQGMHDHRGGAQLPHRIE